MKRVFDLCLSLTLLLVFSPLLLFAAVLVRLFLGKPIFFRQTRAGRSARPFQIIKFRSLTNETAADGQLRTDAERLTGFGKFLRSTSLDELPELWNVLKGDMSLVGPRPLLMEYLPLYTPEQMRRHDVRPGLTGWAQIKGRNSITWEEKFDLDLWYLDHRNFWLDLKIMCLTIFLIMRRNGVSAPGEATMPKFKGANTQ